MKVAYLASILALGAFACGDDDSPEAEAVTMRPPTRGQDVEGALYDDEGRLLPSDEVVAGLPLPRGLAEQPSADDRVHRYWSEGVPLAKLIAYFGPILVTGQVDRIGSGVVYQDAVPRDVRGTPVRLKVGIHPSPRGGARVEVRELPPPRATPVSDDELRDLARELQRGD